MKQITFDGRLGKDAEIITTNGGQQYLRFSVANNSYSKANGEKTEWIDVVCFDQFLVKSKQEVLKKGYYVIVTGTLDVTLATLQDGRTFVNQKVNAVTIEVPNFGNKNENANGAQAQQVQQAPQPQMMTAQPQYQAQVPQYQAQQPQMMPQQPQYQAPQYQSPQYQAQMPSAGGNVTVDSDLPF